MAQIYGYVRVSAREQKGQAACRYAGIRILEGRIFLDKFSGTESASIKSTVTPSLVSIIIYDINNKF